MAANFAVGEDARDSAFDLDRLWFFAACERLLEQSTLELRGIGKGLRIGRLGSRCSRAAEQHQAHARAHQFLDDLGGDAARTAKIGRASCRERVCTYV